MSSGAKRTVRSTGARAFARRLTPLTRMRFRPPAMAWAAMTTSSSMSRAPELTTAWLRAKGLPQRMRSTSAPLRCDRPLERTTSDSRRLVLPAAFGPTMTCGPSARETSSCS